MAKVMAKAVARGSQKSQIRKRVAEKARSTYSLISSNIIYPNHKFHKKETTPFSIIFENTHEESHSINLYYSFNIDKRR